jgi:hypothetical protein
MIDAGTMNDNEIVVRKGLTKDDHVLLAPPADTAGIRTEKLAGLKPRATPAAPGEDTTHPSAGGDSAKGVIVPAAPVAPAGGFKAMTAKPGS